MQSKEGAVGGECVSRVVPRPYGRGAEGQGTTFAGNTYCGINTCPMRPVSQDILHPRKSGIPTQFFLGKWALPQKIWHPLLW